MTNHRQEIETNYRHETEPKHPRQGVEENTLHNKQRKPYFQKILSRASGSNATQRIKFKSVLAQPFRLWNDLEEIVGEFLVDFSASQRSHVIKNVIRFLELKVIMDEYSTNGLLSPTEAVAHVWHVLILETELYRDVVYAIQDFHARPHRFIHHALLRNYNTKQYYEQLYRTQRLFQSYYGTEMPTVLWKEVDNKGSPSDLPTSVTLDNTSVLSGTMDETFPYNKTSTWYPPWLPRCVCFGVFGKTMCARQDAHTFEEIYAQEENVSLLSAPRGLAYE